MGWVGCILDLAMSNASWYDFLLSSVTARREDIRWCRGGGTHLQHLHLQHCVLCTRADIVNTVHINIALFVFCQSTMCAE